MWGHVGTANSGRTFGVSDGVVLSSALRCLCGNVGAAAAWREGGEFRELAVTHIAGEDSTFGCQCRNAASTRRNKRTQAGRGLLRREHGSVTTAGGEDVQKCLPLSGAFEYGPF